jgi:hypothetical protein
MTIFAGIAEFERDLSPGRYIAKPDLHKPAPRIDNLKASCEGTGVSTYQAPSPNEQAPCESLP